MEKESTLSIMDRMVKDNNKGIMMSTTIAEVKFVKQGAIVGFGVSKEIGNNANAQMVFGSSDYMIMCFAVKKSELEKYRINKTEEKTIKMKFKDAPIGARFHFIGEDVPKDVYVKIHAHDNGLVVKWHGNVEEYQAHYCWLDEENGYNFDTEIELI